MQLAFLIAMVPGVATLLAAVWALLRSINVAKRTRTSEEELRAAIAAAQKERTATHIRVDAYATVIDDLSAKHVITGDTAGRLRGQVAQLESSRAEAAETEDMLVSSLSDLSELPASESE